ncbi:hypothetical protein ACQEVC_34645 [Plantactinospora sp. CA-294935]
MSPRHRRRRSRRARRRLTLAVVAGALSGACRALVDCLLEHLTL